MRFYTKLFFVLIFPLTLGAQELPTPENMSLLKPEPGGRLRLYDRLFPTTARLAGENHDRYSDPQVLADIENRLERVQKSGDPSDVFTAEEKQQLEKNLAELRVLESRFFERWYLKVPMSAAIRFQTWLTRRNSPAPQGTDQDALINYWKETTQKNSLYGDWNKSLPDSLKSSRGPQTWGELLLQFNDQAEFRTDWIKTHPDSLPALKKLAQIWAWEDSSVRSVHVTNSQTPAEYWVLERKERVGVPNRFETILRGDFEGLLRLEYSTSLFFNRLSRISTESGKIVYHLESVEKGRTMEPTLKANENGTDKQTYRGAELLRKTKADEFLQREYIRRGSLNLFLGLRTMQLNQIQELMKIHPELTLAVGQLGFSVTGGMAQTVSNRTDSPREQLLKLTATMIDYIEFSQTKDVPAWFERNTRHVLRTVVGGVGSGGSLALPEPTSQEKERGQSAPSCRGVF